MKFGQQYVVTKLSCLGQVGGGWDLGLGDWPPSPLLSARPHPPERAASKGSWGGGVFGDCKRDESVDLLVYVCQGWCHAVFYGWVFYSVLFLIIKNPNHPRISKIWFYSVLLQMS